ncbi:unnamed protein product [Miscanthus lutarioriparius]|uniref:Uncharacterized protein n=1 Tax=Miscanthus lutarioriparius TaxID=422564 RepID=A0A811P786_9POAL|nr:unnamed protein product [Miscanthus lutarioriparius]
MPVSEITAIPSSLSYSLELDPLLRDLFEKKLSLKRNVTAMATELKDARNRLASQELFLAQELEARKVAELKAKILEDEVSKLQKCLEDKDEQLRASLCSTEQDLIFEDDGVAKLRKGIRVLSAHWENRSKELESQLHKHRRTAQEMKRRVMRLELGIQEPRSRLPKLQRLREKRDRALTLDKEVRNQTAVEQPSCNGSGDKHNLWESSAFKLIASMSMLILFTLAKR